MVYGVFARIDSDIPIASRPTLKFVAFGKVRVGHKCMIRRESLSWIPMLFPWLRPLAACHQFAGPANLRSSRFRNVDYDNTYPVPISLRDERLDLAAEFHRTCRPFEAIRQLRHPAGRCLT